MSPGVRGMRPPSGPAKAPSFSHHFDVSKMRFGVFIYFFFFFCSVLHYGFN